MAEKTDKHVLSNGMVVLGEAMDAVESVAFGFMLPAGAAVVPDGFCGSGGVGRWDISIGGALEAGNLSEALELYGDVILRSRLEDEQFGPARQLAIDGVLGLGDDPRQRVMLELRERFYPNPLGRSPVGKIEELEKLTAEKTRELICEYFNISDTIFSIAGKYDFDAVVGQLESRFGDVEKREVLCVEGGERAGKYLHIENDGAQVHIGVMTGSVRPCDEDYYNARVAVSVLSGGMSSRLFTEVREKRGLCYAIGARYHGLKEEAGIACYAGTTPDNAQETLDVVVAEFRRLGEGVSKEEIERAKVGLKSSLILQSESSSSRAGGIGTDYYMLGRVRSLDEMKEKIEETTVESVLSYLRGNKFDDFTVVTIGPKKVVSGKL